MRLESSQDDCFYCVNYNKLYNDYPINEARHKIFDDFTPRCAIHWQYSCDNCKKNIHFNGIAYCEKCNYYTCVKCGDETLIMESFFFYDYYYEIKCLKCSKPHPTLDYLEFVKKHPFQLGIIQFSDKEKAWSPSTKPKKIQLEKNQKPWGSNRITSATKNYFQIELEEPDSMTSREMWNIKAEKWNEIIQEEGDFHHRENILPVMFKLLNLESNKNPKSIRILDVACGTGNVARKVARMGFTVYGVDYSEKMLGYALGKEKELQLGIQYNNIDAKKLPELFNKETFDIIYSNMALMDMDNLEDVLLAISIVLKENGIFVFSISHPIFSWPTAQTLRIPTDSQRGEDKIWVFDTYYRKKTLVKLGEMEDSFLYYTRTISTYLNECIKNRLQIVELVEPKPTPEQILKFPREHYFDDDRRPDFFIVKTKKITAV